MRSQISPGQSSLVAAATSRPLTLSPSAIFTPNGQSLAYVYSRENPNDAQIAKVLTEDEARRIASNIAKLPSLLGKGD